MNDNYLHVFVGPHDNGRTVQFDGIVDGRGLSAAIKITTGVKNLLIEASRVIGGRDACVDINDHAENSVVHLDAAEATGQFIATIKGNAKRPSLTVLKIVNHGSVCDVILGDWSDQSNRYVASPMLDCKSETGPVTVIWLASDLPYLAPGSGPYRFKYWPRWTPLWIHSIIVWGFQTLRRAGFFRSKS